MEIETQDAPFAGAVFSSCTHEWCACILLSKGYRTGFISRALPLRWYNCLFSELTIVLSVARLHCTCGCVCLLVHLLVPLINCKQACLSIPQGLSVHVHFNSVKSDSEGVITARVHHWCERDLERRQLNT